MSQSPRVYVRSRDDRPFQLFYADSNGKRHTRSAGTRNRREAERAAARWQAELASSPDFGGTASWEWFVVRFEDDYLPGKATRTQHAYSTAIRSFERHIGKPSDLRSVDAQTLSQYAGKLRASGLSESSVANYLRHLRSALNWARRMGWVQAVPEIVLQKSGRRLARGRPLTSREIAAMLRAAKTVTDDPDSWRFLMRGLLVSGMRLGEALRLHWTDPPITADMDDGPYPRIIWRAAGQKSRRDEVTPMTPAFADLIALQARTGYVFNPTINGKRVSLDRATRMISQIGEASGVITVDGKTASSHDFRRTFGQYWAKQLKPLQLKKLMRHASIETTLKYYVDIDYEDVAAELWAGKDFQKSV